MNDRLYALEIKIMELEQTVNELNKVLTQQYHTLTELTVSNAELKRRLSSLTEPRLSKIQDEPPPHY